MRVALVSDAVYPYNKGGKEKRLHEISTRLEARGHDVHIYCMKWWSGAELERVEQGVHLHAISRLYPLYDGRRRSIKQGIMFGLACFKLIREHWDVIDVDHMPFFPLFSAKIVCMLKGKKMLATWHEVWGRGYWVKYLGWKGYIAAVVERLSFYMPDEIVAASKLTFSRLNHYVGAHKHIVYIPNGVALRHIQDIKPSRRKSDVLYAGRLLKHKNVNLLIKAVGIMSRKHPGIQCLIVGEGPEEKRLRALVETLNLQANIKFLKFLKTHEELYAVMKSSCVFVSPSVREGFGLVIIEAQACGLPVVTVNHPDNGARFLVEADDLAEVSAESIAEKIEGMMNRGHSADLDHIKDWNQITSSYEKLWES